MSAREEPTTSKVLEITEFKGINLENDRTAIEDGEFSNLLNLMPVAKGNLSSLPNNLQIQTLSLASGETVYAQYVFSLNGKDYIYTVTTAGWVYQTLITSPYTTIKIGMAAAFATPSITGYTSLVPAFSSSGVVMCQYANNIILMGDPTYGLHIWDGSNLWPPYSWMSFDFTNSGYVAGSGYKIGDIIIGSVWAGAGDQQYATVTSVNGTGGITGANITIKGSQATRINQTHPVSFLYTVTTGSGTGAKLWVRVNEFTSAITSMAVYSGILWAGYQRVITYSDSGTPPCVQGAPGGFLTINDPTLHGYITSLIAANGYLYIIGDDSVDLLSNVSVTVPTGGGTATTNYTRQNIEATVGSNFPRAATAYYRIVMLPSNGGIYALNGVVPKKISDPVDRLLALIDSTKPVTGGVTILFNKQVYVISFTMTASYYGVGPAVTLLFSESKWFVANGLWVVASGLSSPLNGTLPMATATAAGVIYKAWGDSSGSPSWSFSSKLYALGSTIVGKQALRQGIHARIIGPVNDSNNAGSTNKFTSVTTDTETALVSTTMVNSYTNSATWINNSLAVVGWTNNSLATVLWSGSGFLEAYGPSDGHGKYLGVTFQGTTTPIVITALQLEFIDRERF